MVGPAVVLPLNPSKQRLKNHSEFARIRAIYRPEWQKPRLFKGRGLRWYAKRLN